MIDWRFPSNDFGEIKGINDSGVSTFRGTPLKSLAREICQNSLDAALESKIIIEFKLFKIKADKFPGKDALKTVFEKCLKFWEVQKAKATKDFFSNAIKEIDKDECTFLRISDFNTTGLLGSHEEINTDWTNLTKSSGASDKKGTAGGSYGIGKFAPFACSNFSTVFYSTYDKNKEEAYQGVSRLVTFRNSDNETTQGIGYYGNEKNTPVYQQLVLDPEFSRKENEYGTDIYIAGYKYENNWEKDIVVSVLDGFLGAIWKEKMEVKIGNIYISKDNLSELMDVYADDLIGYTKYYYKVLTSSETVWSSLHILDDNDAELGLLIGEQDYPKRVAMIRQTGMKIMDRNRLQGSMPFAGVMFINGNNINRRLRKMENPEHTKWEPYRTERPTQAKVLLQDMIKSINNKINELLSKDVGEAVDAIGVGAFIPDEISDTDDQGKDEVISDKVVDIEVKKVKKSAKSLKHDGVYQNEEYNEEGGHKEEGGNEEGWFHGNGHVTNRGPRPGTEAHTEHGGKDPVAKIINVGVEKFICICTDKNKGKYAIRLIPSGDGKDGIIELFLAAEIGRYEAPIIDAKLIGGNDKISIEGNKIKGITFEKNKELKFILDLDFYDFCSMEVKLYATEE